VRLAPTLVKHNMGVLRNEFQSRAFVHAATNTLEQVNRATMKPPLSFTASAHCYVRIFHFDTLQDSLRT
jgi:hypothetical protein